jgi:general L-amino acid transport system permease protein
MTDQAQKTYAPGTHPDLPPPLAGTGALRWARENLFSSPTNIALTLLSLYLLYLIVPALLNWAVFDAVADAGSRNECWDKGSGACWAVVVVRFDQFIYGFYPQELRWRVDLAFVLFLLALVPVLFDNTPYRRLGLIYSLVYPVIAYALLWGGFGLEPVESAKFGGVMLTVTIGVTGIVLSLPIGILLALGRRSDLLVLKTICICFIEFMRGVPLITLLFVASTLLNYFLPPGTYFDLLFRVLIMVVLFSSAYIAECLRGGLAAIPRGQFEAAQALGLTDRAAPGAENRHPGHGQPVHRPLQGHHARRDHRPPGPHRAQPGGPRRLQVAGPLHRDLRLHRALLLPLLLLHVPLQPLPGKKARDRAQALAARHRYPVGDRTHPRSGCALGRFCRDAGHRLGPSRPQASTGSPPHQAHTRAHSMNRLTINDLVAVACEARIAVPATVDVVVTRSTDKYVSVVAALQGIVAVATLDGVFAAASVNTVVAVATIDGVVAAAPFRQIEAASCCC